MTFLSLPVPFSLFIFYGLLLLFLLAILASLFSLAKLGDERKTFIKEKAQSSAFMVTVLILLFDSLESLYLTYKGYQSFSPTHPVILLTVISLVYLISLFWTRRKHGGR